MKVESAPHYVFALLKTLTIQPDADEPRLEKISLFAGHSHEAGEDGNFFIAVADTRQQAAASALRPTEEERGTAVPERLLYLIFDALVDSYFPAIDALDDEIDALEARVISPQRELLKDIFGLKGKLMDVRRLLVNTRDASLHLQRNTGMPVAAEQQLYLRDLYDHISRLLDTVETQRDLLNNALDIYLSSIANRTNEVMKVLTILSTIALPALVVSGIYGMNVKGLPFANSPHGMTFVGAMTLGLTIGLLLLLRWSRWI